MAITKETKVEKVEVVGDWNIQVATDTIIKEDSTEISRSRHRHVLVPFTTTGNKSKGFTHTDVDISGEDSSVQAICNAVWTSSIKTKFKAWQEETLPADNT